MDKVYVLVENGIWDYEEEPTSCEVYLSFEQALKDYEERKKNAKEDIANWLDEEYVTIDEFIDKDSANFSIYESEDYTKTHCNIEIFMKEIK